MAPVSSPVSSPAYSPVAWDDDWVAQARQIIAANGAVVLATVIATKGSVPREAGARMLINVDDIWGTIGGGQLEYDAMQAARRMIAAPDQPAWVRQELSLALGPDMGQCCGGQVRLLLEHLDKRALPALTQLADTAHIAHPLTTGAPVTAATTAPDISAMRVPPYLHRQDGVFVGARATPMRPVFVYGAGHVGRALVGLLPPLGLAVHWVDVALDRFPQVMPEQVEKVPASDPCLIAAHAPDDAFHLVITHSHALDQAICHSVLQRNQFARLGLIGSATKAARFRRRLATAGIDSVVLDRLICPIGLPDITGKSPPRVALSIAAGVAVWQQECAAQPEREMMDAISVV